MLRTTIYLLLSLLCTLGCRREQHPTPATTLRLVSTAPNLTEIVYAVGGNSNMVGRTQVCDFPPEVANLPVVGAFGTPWLEPLLMVQPSHILVTALSNPGITATISQLNIEVIDIPCEQVDDIPQAMRQIAAICNTTQCGEATASELEQGITAARNSATTHFATPPRVLLLLAPEQPVTAGGKTFISELLQLAGGINIANPNATYYRFSTEWLLQTSPDLIICCYETTAAPHSQLLTLNPLWHSLKAIQQKRIYSVTNLDPISRPGPRLLLGIHEFHRILTNDQTLHQKGKTVY